MNRSCAKKYWNSFSLGASGRGEPAWTRRSGWVAMPAGSWSYPPPTAGWSDSIAILRRSRSQGQRSRRMEIG